MMLYQICPPKLYLCTTKSHAPGKRLFASRRAPPLGAVREGWLEKYRPRPHLSRSGSIFLQDRPVQGLFAYEVKPLGDVERNRTDWLALCRMSAGADQNLIEQWVADYWIGNECPTGGCWQYRTNGVTVVSTTAGDGAPFDDASHL